MWPNHRHCFGTRSLFDCPLRALCVPRPPQTDSFGRKHIPACSLSTPSLNTNPHSHPTSHHCDTRQRLPGLWNTHSGGSGDGRRCFPGSDNSSSGRPSLQTTTVVSLETCGVWDANTDSEYQARQLPPRRQRVIARADFTTSNFVHAPFIRQLKYTWCSSYQ